MKIVSINEHQLSSYIHQQLKNFFPVPFSSDDILLIEKYLPETLHRTAYCIDHVSMWKPGFFDVLHSSQYCIFLYYLANTIWNHERQTTLCNKLFFLNKTLNGIDCFYEIVLPDIFFIGHSVGIVLAKATYGRYLVLYQNSTVGKNHGIAPVIEEKVILYPNSAVIGNSLVKKGSVISQGVSVINKTTQPDTLVFNGLCGALVYKKQSLKIVEGYFRDID